MVNVFSRSARCRRSAALALALVLCLGPRSADAERPVGLAAPDLLASTTLGAPAPLSLEGLRGSLVLIAFFRTDCPHCRAAVPSLNARQAEGFARGVRVVGVTRDPRSSVETFVRTHHVEFPVVLVDTEVLREYEVTGFPSLFVIAPDGRIARSGLSRTPSEAEIASLLASHPPLPETPGALDPAIAAWRDDRWADAEALLTAAVQDSRPETARAARTLLAWIRRAADGRFAAARIDLQAGDVGEAFRNADALARGHGDLGIGPRAAALRDEIVSDPARAREVSADAALRRARVHLALGGAAGASNAATALEAVAAEHPGTRAGRHATEISARLRERR